MHVQMMDTLLCICVFAIWDQFEFSGGRQDDNFLFVEVILVLLSDRIRLRCPCKPNFTENVIRAILCSHF
jgi:hypothetical protein